MLFFDYSKSTVQSCQDDEFDLVAGLISALFSFSHAQNRPIEELDYQRPAFEVEQLLDGQQPAACTAGTLITVRCENFAVKEAIKRKLDFIHAAFLEPLEPLSDKARLAPTEERSITDVLLNATAKQHVRARSKALDACIKPFIKDYASYGVRAVAIATSDLTILKAAGATADEIMAILRLVECPVVEPLGWKFRQGWTADNNQVSVVFVNSAFSIVTQDVLKEPLYYLMLCDAYSALGELPRKLLIELNTILE